MREGKHPTSNPVSNMTSSNSACPSASVHSNIQNERLSCLGSFAAIPFSESKEGKNRRTKDRRSATKGTEFYPQESTNQPNHRCLRIVSALLAAAIRIQGCQMAKFYPFLSLDCARVEGVGRQFCHLATMAS